LGLPWSLNFPRVLLAAANLGPDVVCPAGHVPRLEAKRPAEQREAVGPLPAPSAPRLEKLGRVVVPGHQFFSKLYICIFQQHKKAHAQGHNLRYFCAHRKASDKSATRKEACPLPASSSSPESKLQGTSESGGMCRTHCSGSPQRCPPSPRRAPPRSARGSQQASGRGRPARRRRWGRKVCCTTGRSPS